ncbi:hypothetical protein [Microscilla marina]|uniref:hypothetical protein n=1 Tax=Microscilla marina TaxID=1027 RepID=UPI0005D48290|nr:hypothetical protein [Microscilla marina]
MQFTRNSLGLDYQYNKSTDIQDLVFVPKYVIRHKQYPPEPTIRQKAWQAHRAQVSRILYNH